jgi:hypothetical protein
MSACPNVALAARCLMFKSDRSSMIMLAVNAGVPLVSLVTVVALMFRHMILV